MMMLQLSRTKQRARALAFASVAAYLSFNTTLVSILVSEGFCPSARMWNHYNTAAGVSAKIPRRRPWMAISPGSELPDGIASDEEEDALIDDNTVLHQRIKQADPNWYQEYVSELLGGEYCKNRWPYVDLSSMEEEPIENDTPEVQPERERSSIETTTTTTISKPPPAPSWASETSYGMYKDILEKEEEGSEPNADGGDDGIRDEASSIPEESITSENDVDINTNNTPESIVSKLITNEKDQEVTPTIASESTAQITTNEASEELPDLPSVDSQIPIAQESVKEYEHDSGSDIGAEGTRSEVVDNEIENEEVPVVTPEATAEVSDEISKAKKLVSKETPNKDIEETIEKENQVGKVAVGSQDTRAIVYRNITGKTMTCVPLASLIDLGYEFSDLERIQAEFLSIVVLDQRQCPSMGIPSQWKIKDPRAKPEITLVDSMEEGSAMAKRINEEERNNLQSINQRRRRQNNRQRSGNEKIRRSSAAEDDKNVGDRKRRRTTDRKSYPDRNGRRSQRVISNDERQRDRRENSQRRRKSFEDEDLPVERKRRQQRKREAFDADRNPRKIYRVPRSDTRFSKPIDDPPDPNSPIWPDIDTFRALLRKEANFRMNFIGDDWSDVIKEENDWRTNVYKSWLWSLNNGIGPTIVPSIVPPSRYERARRRNQMGRMSPTESLDPQESRRRRRPSQEQKTEPQARRRRPKRAADQEDELNNSENSQISAATQRRSKRRAERRQAPPSD